MKTLRLILFLITLLLTVNLSAQDGTLDPTFGDGGIVETNIKTDKLIQQKLLPDNKMLILARQDTAIVLMKINEDGSFDDSFGTNGKVNFESGEDSTVYECPKFDVTEDGKILLLENRWKRRTTTSGFYAKVTNSLIRLSSNGEYDSEFGENGVLNIYSFESDSLNSINIGRLPCFYDINVRPNNTVLIMGFNHVQYEILRLNYDGSYDLTFGVAGILSIPGDYFNNTSTKFQKVDYDENIYIISNHLRSVVITKYFQNGVLDDNYGNSGNLTIEVGSIGFRDYDDMSLSGLDIDFNNNLLCAATIVTYNTDKSVIIRITPDGILDPTFGENGIRKIILSEFGSDYVGSDYENNSAGIFSMVDGNIVWGGFETGYLSVRGLILAKFNNNGSANTSFDDNGMVFNDYFSHGDYYRCFNYKFVVRPDNQDIVIATTRNDTLCFARYLNSRSHSSIHVSGNVAGKWEGIDTVYVDGDITIPKDSSLTINPGTHVYFTGEYTFDIYGQLIANGTKSDSIYFFSDSLGRDHSTQFLNYKGFWYGLGFKNTDISGSPNSEISYCDFKYALSRGWNTDWESDMDKDVDSVGAPIRLYYSSNVNLHNITISQCKSDIFGNIQMVHSSPEISNITFNDTRWAMQFRKSSNAIVHDLDLEAVRIYIINSSPEFENLNVHDTYRIPLVGENFDGKVTNSIFKDNIYAYANGGGAINLLDGSSPIFEHVLFEGNKATNNSGFYGMGGVAYILDSSPEFVNCEFKNNMSVGNGSVFYLASNDYSQPWTTKINNCLFVKNKSTNGSGTIYTVTNTQIEMINSTLADNTAPYAAAISNDAGVPNIITNSIIYGNGPNLNQQFSTHQTQHVLSYNIIQGSYYGIENNVNNLLDVDPMFRDTSVNDYHLQSIACGYGADSPGIDAGDPDIGDYVLDCETGGLGTMLSDIGAYGGAGNWWDISVLPVCHFAGDVSGVWDCGDIYVDGDIVIPYGDTLQINSSVEEVHITGPYQIKVEGVLLAIGPENNHEETALNGNFIHFQGNGVIGEEWKGIYFNNLNNTDVGTSIIKNCRFDYADKMDMTYQGGGAIAIYNSDKVEIKHTVFYANKARLGGAMYIENSSPHIEDCYFQLNGKETGQDAQTVAEGGGAIYMKDANPYLHKLRFVDNRSTGGGGAIVLDNSSPVISNVLFVKNKTNGLGGAVQCINGSSPKFVNMTSADNIAGTAGGTFYLNPNSNPEIINSIMFGDTKPEIYLGGGTPTVTYSLIDSASTESYFGAGCLDTDPKFEKTTGNYYYLSSTACGYGINSDAIDAGHPDSLDSKLDCSAGLGTSRADMGYYGGRYADITTGVEETENSALSKKYVLLQNFPNPFNQSTTITFAIPKAGKVSLRVYNMLGEEVAELINREMNAGSQSINFNASKLSPGLYFYRIKAGNFVDFKKMLLLK